MSSDPGAAAAESRVNSTIVSGSVKLISFQPSGRKIWIVVGRDNEYWVDLDLVFCSCKDFYFTTLSGGPECYHLKSVRRAVQEGKFIAIGFDDSEYTQFLKAIAEDSANIILYR